MQLFPVPYRGVLTERANYYTILAKGDLTIWEGVLIEGGALTEVVLMVSIFKEEFSPIIF